MKIVLILLSVFLFSCLHKKEPMLQENGVVVGKQFSPDTRRTVMGTGMSSNGGIVITTHQVGEDEKYTIVFKCDHGTIFNINDPEVYAKLREGDKVKIDYYELVNKKGVVKDYEFVDANKQ